VFVTAEALADWMASPAYTYGASIPLTKEQAMAFVGVGWAPSGIGTDAGFKDGVTAVADMEIVRQEGAGWTAND
jgi:hypothetical protein